VKKEQLLAEIEDILRRMPSLDDFEADEGPTEETLAWLGHSVAAIQRWDAAYMSACTVAAHHLRSTYSKYEGFYQLKTLLYQARADLRMEIGQLSVVIQAGQMFDYFDELRKVIQTARTEVFFIDPYLDAEFVSRYLPQVSGRPEVRLLGGPKRMGALLPAVDLFAHQSQLKCQVRSSNELHDRYLFIDGVACYLSGASFKDGAKKAPATFTQITDAFHAMWETYDGLWKSAVPQR
jgi:hypothetical protein